jgi:peptidyl-prolyl cis-trans isomerase SurA
MDIANEVTKMLKNDTINSKHVLDKINKDSELNLRVRTNKFDKESTNFLKGRDLKTGLNKAFELDGKFYVIKVTELLNPKEKEFSEAKGAATSDYQNFLEKNWLEELAKKHAIKINYDVLYSLGK